MLFRYRLLDEAGEDLGPFASRRSDWVVGERLSRWHGEELVVVSVVGAEQDEGFEGYVVVRAA